MAAQSVGYLQQLGTPELYHARDTVLLFYRLTLVIIVGDFPPVRRSVILSFTISGHFPSFRHSAVPSFRLLGSPVVSLVDGFVSVVFRWFRFGRFARFGGFVFVVSVISFWSFRFVVSGFSSCLAFIVP